jgi:hypothetical protein
MIHLGEGRSFSTISAKLDVCNADRLHIFSHHRATAAIHQQEDRYLQLKG